MNLLLTNMKTALQNDSMLSAYLGTSVEICKWNPDALPDFDKYCVVLSPENESEDPAGVLGVEKTFSVQLVCLVRNYGLPDALTGTTSPASVGVHKLAEDVRSCLRNNNLSGAVIADNNPVASSPQIGRAIEETEHVLAARLDYTGRRKVQVNS